MAFRGTGGQADRRTDGQTHGRTDGQTDKRMKVPCVLQDFVPFGTAAHKLIQGLRVLISGLKRSPKGNMWSAIPVAQLCMAVNWNKRQGSCPKGDKVL